MSLKRFFERLSRLRRPGGEGIEVPRPSSTYVAALILILAVFIMGGGVYDLVTENPITVLPQPGVPLVYPGLSGQFLAPESVGAMILLGAGVMGIYLVHRGGRASYRPKELNMLVVVGLILFFIGYLGCYYLLQLKLAR
jgi:hypothetical protein